MEHRFLVLSEKNRQGEKSILFGKGALFKTSDFVLVLQQYKLLPEPTRRS